MSRRTVLSAVLAFLAVFQPSAFAQSLGDFVTISDGFRLAVSGPKDDGFGGGICSPNTCVTPGKGVSLESLSSALGLSNLSTRIDSAFASLAIMNSQVAAINARVSMIEGEISRSYELIAVAAALKDAVPNPGDRFAIRINTAGFSGKFAGAIGLGVNITDRARLSLNYGQGRTQGIVSGGMNFSFH